MSSWKEIERVVAEMKAFAAKQNITVLMPIQKPPLRQAPWQPWRVSLPLVQNELIIIDYLPILK